MTPPLDLVESRHNPPWGRAQPDVRLAFVIQNLNYGGMERVLHDLARRLPARGFDVHVVVLQYLGRFAEELADRVTFHQVEPMSRLSLLRPGKLIRLLRDLRPHIVHSHSGVWLKAVRAAQVARVPIVIHTEHGRPDPVPLADRWIDNVASRGTSTVIAVSQPLAQVLTRQVLHDPSRLQVIENGVDTARLRPRDERAPLRRALGIPEDALVIGSIGRLESIKNYGLALRAFARVTSAGPDNRQPWLVLVGDGSERTLLEQQAHALGIAQRVRFLGWRTDAERLYGAFDLFTLTSHSEGTSISLLEAMSTAICPVVTDVGGNRSALGDELETLLVPGDDAHTLAAAWQALLNDAPLRQTHAARARRRVIERFSITRMVDEHITLYRSALEAVQRRSAPRASHVDHSFR